MSDYEVPTDNEVVQTLTGFGRAATAVELCQALVKAGHPVRQSQLAIQRAADRGRILINKDWTLAVRHEAVAA